MYLRKLLNNEVLSIESQDDQLKSKLNQLHLDVVFFDLSSRFEQELLALEALK